MEVRVRARANLRGASFTSTVVRCLFREAIFRVVSFLRFVRTIDVFTTGQQGVREEGREKIFLPQIIRRGNFPRDQRVHRVTTPGNDVSQRGEPRSMNRRTISLWLRTTSARYSFRICFKPTTRHRNLSSIDTVKAISSYDRSDLEPKEKDRVQR